MAAECATDPVENPLWWFAQEFYKREGVEAALLDLQNHQGADVLLLLAACWLSSEGFEWPRDDADFDKGLKDYESWRDHVIAPLRRVRYHLPRQALPGFRSDVKTLELESEKLGLAGLFSLMIAVEAERWDTDRLLAQDNLAMVLACQLDPQQVESVMASEAIEVLLEQVESYQTESHDSHP